jgi:hypothetical protein
VSAHDECATRGRPRFELGDIVRAHREAFERTHPTSLDQRRALSAIAMCRTEALGGHLDVCTACGHEKPSYNSCRNRHCPKCQSLAQEQWVAERLLRILPVRHFHVVFTLPAEIRPLAAFRPRALYDLLFEAATRTLLDVGRGPKLGAILGVTAVLHTWTRDLRLHPHLHCIVTGGGLAPGALRWISTRADYLLPVQILGTVFRGKLLEALRRAHRDDAFRGFDDFEDPEGFERLCSSLAKKRWVVYSKKPFAGPDQVFRYLGRYTHRVGIANSRLLDVGEHHVTFRTKDGKAVTLDPIAFLARFVQHVLPKGFVKIRHSGLYAASNVRSRLRTAHALVTPPANVELPTPAPATILEILLALTGRDVRRCSLCDAPIVTRPLPRDRPAPSARAPP